MEVYRTEEGGVYFVLLGVEGVFISFLDVSLVWGSLNIFLNYDL